MSHTVSSKMQPGVIQTIDDAEYERWLQLGIVYEGLPVPVTTSPLDTQIAELVDRSESATRAELRALMGADAGGLNDGVVAALVDDGESLTGERLRAAFVATAPLPALRSWRTALGGRATAPADIFLMADSVGEGEGATAKSRRWADQALSSLRARYPAGVVGGAGYIPACNYELSYPSDWTLTGGAKDAFGFGNRSVTLTAGGHMVSIAQTCTSFRLYYIKGAANTGPFTVTIDGGAPTTVTPATTGGFAVDYWTSPALTAGSHSIVVGYGGSQTAFILGGYFFNGDEAAGIRLIDASHYGYSTQQYANDFGSTAVPGNNFEVSQYLALPVGPSLVLIALGLNDYQAGTSPATVRTRVETIITTVKALHASKGWLAPSFLLLGMYQRTDVASPAHPWSEYVDAYRAIAAADPSNVACLALTDRIDTTTEDFGILTFDNTHPADKGHGFIADVVTAQLLAA